MCVRVQSKPADPSFPGPSGTRGPSRSSGTGLGPITQFLATWAVAIEIARTPASAARLRGAMDELHAVHAWAHESLARE